jgi:cation-transporting ATPase F
LFNCRSLTQSMFRVGVFSNRWMVAGVVAMALLQLLFTYAPFMNDLFLTAPTSLEDWTRVLGVSLLGYLVVELEKWIRRRKI